MVAGNGTDHLGAGAVLSVGGSDLMPRLVGG